MWKLFRRRKKETEKPERPAIPDLQEASAGRTAPEAEKEGEPDIAAEVRGTVPGGRPETPEEGEPDIAAAVLGTVPGDRPEEEAAEAAEDEAAEAAEDEAAEAAEDEAAVEQGIREVEIDPEKRIEETEAEMSGKKKEGNPKKAAETQAISENKAVLQEADKERSLYDWTGGKKKKNKSSAKGRTVMIGKVEIGRGKPKICVSVCGKTPEEIENQLGAAVETSPDLIEWRADYFDEIAHKEVADTVVEKMSLKLGNIPLIFTYRNKREGGQKDLDPERYQAVIRWAAGRKEIDAIDVEGLHPEVDTEILTAEVHQAGKPVIGSMHYFQRTPKKQELAWTLERLERTGADILKLAVMPSKPKEVLRLMEITEEKSRETGCPLITMAMGDLGKITRVSGRITGSAVTFGTAGVESAPGQLPVDQLRKIMELL